LYSAEARPEDRNAASASAAKGYTYPNKRDAAIMEVNYGLPVETKKLTEEGRKLRRVTWAVVALTLMLAFLTAALLFSG